MPEEKGVFERLKEINTMIVGKWICSVNSHSIEFNLADRLLRSGTFILTDKDSNETKSKYTVYVKPNIQTHENEYLLEIGEFNGRNFIITGITPKILILDLIVDGKAENRPTVYNQSIPSLEGVDELLQGLD